jgi:formylmethanofuran dehydrogenase subunit E
MPITCTTCYKIITARRMYNDKEMIVEWILKSRQKCCATQVNNKIEKCVIGHGSLCLNDYGYMALLKT